MKRLPDLTYEETLEVMAAGRGLCLGAISKIAQRARERGINPDADERRYADMLVRAAQAGKLKRAPTGSRSLYINEDE